MDPNPYRVGLINDTDQAEHQQHFLRLLLMWRGRLDGVCEGLWVE